jgi:hypothetical protein
MSTALATTGGRESEGGKVLIALSANDKKTSCEGRWKSDIFVVDDDSIHRIFTSQLRQTASLVCLPLSFLSLAQSFDVHINLRGNFFNVFFVVVLLPSSSIQ